MQHAPQSDAFSDIEPEAGETHEDDVNALVRRIAASIDAAIDPARDERAAVAEALMRLALGVHLYAAGAPATRERLLAMAMRTISGDAVH